MFIPKPLEYTLLNATSGTGDSIMILNYIYKTVVIKVSGIGAVIGVLEASNDGANWVIVKTYTADDYYETTIPFKYIRARIVTPGGKNVKADLSANK